MEEFLTLLFWGLTAFTVADYVLGRAQVRDVLRAVVAAVFAVAFVLVVHAKGLV